ncbi:MAG: MarR family transcriptional regulator [Planctomycetota bacterium]|nr:MarR family transcriptional regulator [Planctomycetota bacterium]
MSHVEMVLEQWRRERPDLEVGPMGLTGRLKRIGRHLERQMEKVFAVHDMNLASFDVLATLRRSGAPYRLSPGDLMANTMVTSGTMTNRVDQLVRAGHVERIKNPQDGRSVLITLTDKGLKVIDVAVTDHVANLARLTSGLTESEAKRLDRLLDRYLATLESIEDPDG